MALQNEYHNGKINKEEYLGQRWMDEMLTLHGSHRVRPCLEGLGLR